MNPKIAQIEDMMAEGWDVEEMASGEDRIAVLLRRGAALTTVVLDREDAFDVLFGSGLDPRPAADGRAQVLARH